MAVVTKPYKGAPEFVGEIQGEYILAIQVGNDTGATGRTQMKRITLAQLQEFVNKGFGSAWRFRGAVSSLPNDPVTNDYFLAASTFTDSGKTYVLYHLYGYNGTAWSDISGLLMQYIEKSAIADNLTTDDPTKVLSAKQGKILNDTLVADVADLQQQIDAISGGITPKGTIASINPPYAAPENKGWMYYVTSLGKYMVSDGTQWLDFGTYPIYYFALRSSFPASGALNSLYIAGDEQKIYWWTGTEYVSDTAKMAEIDGYYQEMTVGDAEQLVATQVIEEQALYSYRTSGGNVDIGNRSYNKKIVGGTLGVNQQVRKTSLPNGTWSNLTVTRNDDGSITLNGSTDGRTSIGNIAYTNIAKGHVYFMQACVGLTLHTGSWSITNNANYGAQICKDNGTYSSPGGLVLEVMTARTFNNQKAYLQVIDLTVLLGSTIADYLASLDSANLGAGVAWFRKYFPKLYYAYNDSSLMSVNTSAHKMVGFNQYDKDTVDYVNNRYINYSTGELVSWGDTKAVGYVRILGGNEYELYSTESSHVFRYSLPIGLAYYDSEYNFISGDYYTETSNSFRFTPPANAMYLRFSYEGTNLNEICLHLVWSGTRNGEYEPYEEHSYPLDSSLELNGIPKIDSDGNLYFDGDEYESDGTVTRNYHKDIFNGTENWQEYSQAGANTSGAMVGTTVVGKERENIINNLGIPTQVSPNGSTIYGITQIGQNIFITYPTSMFADVTAWKNYLSTHNLILIRDVASPVIEQAEPYNEVQFVNDWGTEQFVDAGVEAGTRDVEIPVYAFTNYPPNLRDKLQHLPMTSKDGDGKYFIEQVGKQMSLKPMSGYFPSMHVGTADNLAGKGTVGANFTFRTAGGSADIGSGSARLDSIKGNTLMMNQILPISTVANKTVGGITFTNNHDGSFTMNGTYSGTLNYWIWGDYGSPTSLFQIIQGHVYFLRDITCFHDRGTASGLFLDTNLRDAVRTATATTEVTGVRINDKTGTYTNYKIYPILIDLTQMFGAGNEPTVDEFKALFPLDYYDYAEGFPLNFKGTGLKTVGFNEFDGLCENGMWGETGKESASGRTRTTNLIRVVPNTNYYFCYPNPGSRTFLNFQYYDANGNALINISITKNTVFTTPSNACYLGIFTAPDNFGAFDICINLSWSGIRNGEYEPYWDSTLSLPITTLKGKASGSDESVIIFPDGMNKIDDVYDELTAKKAVKRINKINLGTLNWSYVSRGAYFKVVTSVSELGKLLCNQYDAKASATYAISPSNLGSAPNMSIYRGGGDVTERKTIYLKNTSKTASDLIARTGTGNAAWLDDVWLYYSGVTPIEYTLDEELNLNYRVDDFGTEQLLPENESTPTTAPMVAQIAYAMNAVDTLRNLDKNFTNLATLDGLIAIINSKCGVNIVRGNFDSANNKYTFS